MEHSTFGERLEYLRWITYLRQGSPPSWTDIGEGIGYTSEGVSKWRVSEKPPRYEVHRPLADYFELKDSEPRWLIDGVGEPPEPQLWKVWARYRRATPKAVPKGATKQITRADVAAAKAAARKKPG